MNIPDIILEFSAELRKILGENLPKIILYGSYARGDYHKSSDVDVMILVTLDHKISQESALTVSTWECMAGK